MFWRLSVSYVLFLPCFIATCFSVTLCEIVDLVLNDFYFLYVYRLTVFLWSDDGPSWGRNWLPLNKHILEIVLVVTEDLQIVFIELNRTQPLYCDRQYG